MPVLSLVLRHHRLAPTQQLKRLLNKNGACVLPATKIQLRTMASFLVDSDEPKYGFLKDLGLTQKNLGVYNGKWMGSGEVCKMEIFNLGTVAKRIGNYSNEQALLKTFGKL